MDTGTTAFMLCCIIGLTIMVPGLALRFGGMVRVSTSISMTRALPGALRRVDRRHRVARRRTG